jgi:dTDP-4-amino-4,6-dideoxygalactose transaminase
MLPFARPELGPEEERAVIETLRSGWVSTGPRCERFEQAFAGFIGVPHAVAVGSCSAGLHLILRAAGAGPGTEVITSPITFPATANAILHCGAVPVLADVHPDRLTLDPSAVEAAITPRTRAIVCVHLAGWPTDMEPIGRLARRHGLAVLEDASHALGASYRGVPAGALGDAAAFSFYATKNITTGEGGMVTTARSEWVVRMQSQRLHGLDLDASRRQGRDYRHWEAVSDGWKYNLGDIAAAIGLVQLEKLPGFLERRRALDRRYREELASERAVRPLVGPMGSESAAHLFPLLLAPGALRIGRDEILRALLAENIGVGVHFRGLPLHRFFRETLGWRPEMVPVATAASDLVFSLPLYPGLTEADQGHVLGALRRILRYYAA